MKRPRMLAFTSMMCFCAQYRAGVSEWCTSGAAEGRRSPLTSSTHSDRSTTQKKATRRKIRLTYQAGPRHGSGDAIRRESQYTRGSSGRAQEGSLTCSRIWSGPSEGEWHLPFRTTSA